MKPFLRPTDRGQLAPVGWVSEPAGIWAGREVDVVYDPRRHDVLLVRSDPGENARRGFEEAGYRRTAVGDGNELWVRDRAAAALAALDRIGQSPGLALERASELGGRAL